MPDRVQRSRAKGAKLPPNTRYVGRPTKFGNPFTIHPTGDGQFLVWHRNDRWLDQWGLSPLDIYQYTQTASVVPTTEEARRVATNLYRALLADCPAIRNAIAAELRGFDHLACWCPLDHACHCNVLIEILSA